VVLLARPHPRTKARAGDHPIAPLDEAREQLALARGERDAPAVEAQLAVNPVELQRSPSQQRVLGGTPDARAHARDQLAGLERGGEEVVGSGVEQGFTLGRVETGGHDDARVPALPQLATAPGLLVERLPGAQRDSQERHEIVGRREVPQRPHDRDPEAGGLQQVRQGVVAVDEEDSHGARADYKFRTNDRTGALRPFLVGHAGRRAHAARPHCDKVSSRDEADGAKPAILFEEDYARVMRRGVPCSMMRSKRSVMRTSSSPARRAPGLALLCLAALALVALCTHARPAQAHGGDTSYVVLTPHGATLDGVLNLDLFDAEGALQVSRTDLAAGRQRQIIADHLVAHLSLSDETGPCPIEPAPDSLTIDMPTTRVFMKFVARCARPPARLDVKFTILFDVMGPGYLGIVTLADAGHPATLMFTKWQPTGSLGVLPPSAPADASGPSPSTGKRGRERWSWRGLVAAIRIGIGHIWSGADHMLFLLALLMTSVLVRTPDGWTPRPDLRGAITDVAKIVTGFTLTHSITLTLAALGLLRPAARIIEPAIAASVAIAAIDNLRPFLRGRKWIIASSLGLLHGFGFASALNELALPEGTLVMTLCGFALGVETGQFIFVLAFVPLAFRLRATRFYQRGIVRGGSLLIALVALVWMVERAAPRR
jgi:hypothetical protein